MSRAGLGAKATAVSGEAGQILRQPSRACLVRGGSARRAWRACLRRYRDLAIAYLMLLCGLRTQEVLNLRLTDIDIEDRRLRVQGKGGRGCEVLSIRAT